MTADACSLDPFNTSYLQFALIIPLYLIFQLVLLSNTSYYEYKQCTKDSAENEIKFLLRFTYLLVELIGLSFITMELFRFVIDPYTLILHGNILCNYIAYSTKLINVIYYACYALHMLLRLSLNKYTTISLSFIAFIPLIFIVIILSLSPSPGLCLWKWIPIDINIDDKNQFSICSFQNDENVNIFIFIGIGFAMISNLIFSVVFAVKLKNIFSKNKNDTDTKEQSFRSTSLLIKNSILTFVGCILTATNYIIYFILYPTHKYGKTDAVFLLHSYTDIFMHTLILLLMFNYNDKYYKKLCCCCILICFDKLDNSLKEIEIESYLNTSRQKSDDNVSNTDNIDISSEEQKTDDHTLSNGEEEEEEEEEEKETGNNNIGELQIELAINNSNMISPIAMELPYQLTPLPDIQISFERERDDSMQSTLDDAEIIKALKPIQKGIKRFIDKETEMWSPIQYEYKPDLTDFLKPKKSVIKKTVNKTKAKSI